MPSNFQDYNSAPEFQMARRLSDSPSARHHDVSNYHTPVALLHIFHFLFDFTREVMLESSANRE
jgi:hypothetical protein